MGDAGVAAAVCVLMGATVGLVLYETIVRRWGLSRHKKEEGISSSATIYSGSRLKDARLGEKGSFVDRDNLRRKVNRKSTLVSRLANQAFPFLQHISQKNDRFLPMLHRDAETYRTMLAGAGWQITPETWRTTRILVAVAGGIFAWMIVAPGQSVNPLASIALLSIAAVAGWTLPRLFLVQGIAKRRRVMESQLPEAMELLGITIAAGAPVEQSFREVAAVLQLPLAGEFELVDQEVNLLGHSRDQALGNFAARCQSKEISSFVAQLTQAVSQGSSIAQGLSLQAALAREKAQAATLERIRKMPTKLDIILSCCFLPPTVVLVIAPTIVNLMAFLNETMQ